MLESNVVFYEKKCVFELYTSFDAVFSSDSNDLQLKIVFFLLQQECRVDRSIARKKIQINQKLSRPLS
jgi:hypothetical protein